MPSHVPAQLDAAIQTAVSILKSGGLLAMPTETVYGLACDARNEEAIACLYALKGRPGNHPVIVHLASVDQLSDWAVDIPKSALILADSFWPGPMTLILKKHPSVSDAVTGGQQTVGLRIPNHPVALALLNAFNGGLAAPSANKFGKISPTTAEHVRQDLGDAIPMVLDGGACPVGVESTIIDCSSTPLRILRPGDLSHEAIQQALLDAGCSDPVLPFQPKQPATVRVSGDLESHYAPNAAVELLPTSGLTLDSDSPVAVMAFAPKPASFRGEWLEMPAQPEPYAQRLYAALRRLDATGAPRILIEAPPLAPGWEAVLDRLVRAAAPRG